jgi:hypothetical protein
MRLLTFEGFLKQYIAALSKKQTMSLALLAREVAEGNLRLKEPLFLYAFITGKERLLFRQISDVQLRNNFDNVFGRRSRESLLEDLAADMPDLPTAYRKVWRSFVRMRDTKKNENQTKLMILKKIKALQTEKGISNYRIHTDLRLNPGNLNAFIKHENPLKISLDSAREVLDFVRERAGG